MALQAARELPHKLRITATMLGCVSQKDLCAAFRRVNPNTDFDLERSYKWMQGRALPRSARLYADWAALVGTEASHPADWLASCALGDFVDALCARHGLDRGDLLRRAGVDGGRLAEPPDQYLCGVYATYSRAQSPHYRGRLVRGVLAIEPAEPRAKGLRATYTQNIATGRAVGDGRVELHERALYLDMRVRRPGTGPLACILFRPSPPASVLAGLLCATVTVDPTGQPPYATRIVMVRVAMAAPELEASSRYLDTTETPARDLAALGLRGPEVPALDAAIGQFLNGRDAAPADDGLPVADYAALAMVCDRLWV